MRYPDERRKIGGSFNPKLMITYDVYQQFHSQSWGFSITIDLAIATKAHLCESVKWIAKMRRPEHWDLIDDQVAALLGLRDAVIYREISESAVNDALEELRTETLERFSLLLGIWRTLQELAPANRRDLALSMFTRPSLTIFGHQLSIKEYLLELRSVDRFYEVTKRLRANL